jgi:Crp-like helix-turn-helix domain
VFVFFTHRSHLPTFERGDFDRADPRAEGRHCAPAWRLARALVELGKYVGQDDGAGRVVIRHKIGQSELAAMAGVARENVSQVMSNWKRNKVVSRSSGFYWLIDITRPRRIMDSQADRRRMADDTIGPSPRLKATRR